MSEAVRDGAWIPPARTGRWPVRAGNRVRPLVDGKPAFRRICEAVESARRSVWVTVAYLEHDVPMPDGRGSLFDVLDAASARGLDVRVLFWREPGLPELEPESTHFPGTAEERAWLERRGSGFRARWDRHPKAYCHHQKSWLVDAGSPGEVAFVGGINLVRGSSLAGPGHPAVDCVQDHDVYVEIEGPAASDVHRNFAERWNGASERDLADGAWPAPDAVDDVAPPSRESPAAGEVPVQITRTVMAGLYGDEADESILEQYLGAIGAARRSIYLEDQAIASPVVIDALAEALGRGVEVVFLVPGQAHPAFVRARRDPRGKPLFEKLAALGDHAGFTLAAICGSRGDGRYDEVYVHSKIMLIDDAWATIGSTNVAQRSFHRDTELNASFWHADTVRALRVELLQEHLGEDTSGRDDLAALRRYRQLALANRDRRTLRQPLEGLAYALTPSHYGLPLT